MTDTIAPVACSNCSDPVKVRRPSLTGKHFCTRPKCQAAKQRFYRSRGRDLADQTQSQLVAELVRDLAHLERVSCHLCDLENALPGWAHRKSQSSPEPCFALGNKGGGLPAGMLDSIWPDRV